MTARFKVGPAKTRDGREVMIYTVDGVGESRIVGSIRSKQGTWDVFSWDENGTFYFDDDIEYDLLPNVEPKRVMLEGIVTYNPFDKSHNVSGIRSKLGELSGQRVRITIEELQDE